MFAFLRAIASIVKLVAFIPRLPSLALQWRKPRRREPELPSEAPVVPREALKLLDDVEAPTREEIERYVPEKYRELGPEWTFTRGKVLVARELRRETLRDSDGYFDGPTEWTIYDGAYGYYDHNRQLHIIAMKETDSDRDVRLGRTFIILFDRRSPQTHHVFTTVRVSHPAKRWRRA